MRPQRTTRKDSRRSRSCPTGKRRYPDKASAVAALHSAQRYARAGDARRRECRAYPCGKCHGYHLTSQP